MSKRVLVVDDDPVLLQMVDRWLTLAGHHVTTFTHFEDARQFLSHTTPDILIADVRLGAFNGIHLALHLRDREAHMPIVVVSGFEDAVLRDEVARCGGTFLLKPLTAPALLAHLQDEPGPLIT